jgi:hypothetical protein
MALCTDIEQTRDGALQALNEAHDYFTYSKKVWRILQVGVQREGLRFSLRNPSTNSEVNEMDLIARAQRYTVLELPSATLQQFVSIFENYLLDVLRYWLVAYPDSLSSRTLTGREILDLPDKAAIVNALIDHKLRQLSFEGPRNWFKYLKELVNIRLPAASDMDRFVEIKATRDVLVHGQGLVNSYYLEKAGTAARARIGEPLEVPEPYHLESWRLICKLVRETGTEMAARG